MTYYEHTYIATPEVGKKDIEKIEKKIEEILSKYSGKIIKFEDWGLRSLAYPINKNSKGYYRNLYIEGSENVIKDIEQYEKYDDKILKYLSFKIKKIPSENSDLNNEKK